MHNLLNKKNKSLLVSSSTLLLLIIINIVYFYLNLKNYINSSDYAFNELFINYQAGLIRRGLLGEIFWIINNFLDIKPIVFFSYLFLVIHLLQVYLFYKIFKKFSEIYLIYILIFFSPALLLFYFYDVNLYFLKDSITTLTILFHALILINFFNKKENKESYIKTLKYLLLPILILSILIHEYQVLYLGVHFLLSLSIAKDKKIIIRILKIYLILLLPIFFVLVFLGNQFQYENLNLILNAKFNITVHPQLGGGFYKAIGGFYLWHFYYFTYNDFINLFFCILLSIGIFYTIFHYFIIKKIIIFHSIYQKKYLIFFVPVIATFILATDHGRNISLISFHLIAFYAVLKFDFKKLKILENNKNFLLNSLLILFLFFYVFLWKMDQMAGFWLKGEPNSIIQSSLFSEIITIFKIIYNYIDLNIIELPRVIVG
tara:strand:- start:71 stop:1360 length:1290 start_codon:yes stop_codon:yes gene_type:complete